MAFTIGELGKATGTKVETVRYYEQIGLMPKPRRTDGNYRSYGRPELERLSFIRRARGLGFSLDQVRALLDLSDEGRLFRTVDPSCTTMSRGGVFPHAGRVGGCLFQR